MLIDLLEVLIDVYCRYEKTDRFAMSMNLAVYNHSELTPNIYKHSAIICESLEFPLFQYNSNSSEKAVFQAILQSGILW